MITFRKYGICYSEVWFDDQPDRSADIIIWRQSAVSVPDSRSEPFHTLVVDLRQSEEDLLAAVHKDSRYEIRRAEKSDMVVAEQIMDPENRLAEFLAFYNAFALQKGRPVIDILGLERIHRGGHLALSRVNREGTPLVWHAYYCSRRRARLLYSASLFRDLDSGQRNLIGRANRYLHWHDMLAFKEAGFQAYDLGGWSPPEVGDVEKMRINRFKEQFGGRLVTEFNCLYPASIKGRIALAVKRFLGR